MEMFHLLGFRLWTSIFTCYLLWFMSPPEWEIQLAFRNGNTISHGISLFQFLFQSFLGSRNSIFQLPIVETLSPWLLRSQSLINCK